MEYDDDPSSQGNSPFTEEDLKTEGDFSTGAREDFSMDGFGLHSAYK
jgi:hypothetical protein